MKTTNLLFAILIFASLRAEATIYTVDNLRERNPEQKLYPTIQEAHDVADSGDTLFIIGNGYDNPYSSSDIIKKLIIIGPGFNLSENPMTRQGKMEAYISDINFKAGSEYSKLLGICNTHSSSSSKQVYVKADDIEISFCKLNYVYTYGYSNTTITRNYFQGYISYSNSSSYTASDGFYIANNIFASNLDFRNDTQGELKNNIFLKGLNIDNTNLILTNNIFLTEKRSDIIMNNMIEGDIISNSNYKNNLAYVNLFKENDGYNNKSELTLSDIFTNINLPSSDLRYQIKEGGPADGTGSDGTDIGIFGGNAPYQLSGIIPSLPTITEISTTGIGTIEDGLPIKVTIK